jgi:cytochrome c oxidase subunit II
VGRVVVSTTTNSRSARGARALAVIGLVALVATGCTAEQQRGFLPGDSANEVTDMTGMIKDMWVGSWIAALVIGLIVWGLVIWCSIVYRRRRSDTGYPVQLRYHVPLELTFTLIPILMVGVLFFFTQRDLAVLEDATQPADVEINVVGKQWSWDFNYTSEDVHEQAGVQSLKTGEPGAEEYLPTLYLPVDQTVRFTLDSRDVVHSFWITDFLYKKDMYPGHSTTFTVTPTAEGTYNGKCAELCGEYHSDMLFNVEVVSQEEFDAHMQDLRDAGQTGTLPVDDLSRNEQGWNQDGTTISNDVATEESQ